MFIPLYMKILIILSIIIWEVQAIKVFLALVLKTNIKPYNLKDIGHKRPVQTVCYIYNKCFQKRIETLSLIKTLIQVFLKTNRILSFSQAEARTQRICQINSTKNNLFLSKKWEISKINF
jgi:hypothetical protein